jgi:hypothetical protein
MQNRIPKKETFRRGWEGFFLFRGPSWSQGPNGKNTRSDQKATGWSHVPAEFTSSWSSSSQASLQPS